MCLLSCFGADAPHNDVQAPCLSRCCCLQRSENAAGASMADIFVSYKRADRERVARIVALLEDEGWTVWWDNRVFGDAHWNALIERELQAARCVAAV